MPWERRNELVDAKVDELVALGARLVRRDSCGDPDDAHCSAVMQDPEGIGFRVS